MVARVHGNTGKKKKLGLSLKEIEDVVQFVLNYAGVCVECVERRGGGLKEREGEREREEIVNENQQESYIIINNCHPHYLHVPDSNAMLLPGRVPGTRALTSSSSLPAPPSTPSGSCISRQQQPV